MDSTVSWRAKTSPPARPRNAVGAVSLELLRSLACVVLASAVAGAPGPAALAQAPAGQGQPPAVTTPAPAPAASAAGAEQGPARLHVRDGQLLSHAFPVFVTQEIEPAMKPVLRLTGAHLVTRPSVLEREPLQPRLVAPRQTRTIRVAGADVQAGGTLLLFDLGNHDVPLYKSAVRLLPTVEWTAPGPASGGPGTIRRVVSEEEIHLGNMPGALLWTCVIVTAVVALLIRWSYSKSRAVTGFKARPALLLITGPDGYLSLWRTQLLLWTLAVGSLVFLFGLVQLHVPEIPETLVALMGMSLLTGFLAKKAAPSPNAGPSGGVPPPPPVAAGTGPELADLISSWNAANQRIEFSLPKAQMVFWTALILVLFLVKSILDGALWAVPWQIVALTGFSQTGYVGDKFVNATP